MLKPIIVKTEIGHFGAKICYFRCYNCQIVDWIYESNIKQGRGRFCKRKCYDFFIKNNPSPLRKKLPTQCNNCSEIVWRTPFEIKIKKHNFCNKKCRYQFDSKIYQGKNNPNFGRKHTLSEREKMSQANIGRTSPFKGKKRPNISAENSPHWKGDNAKKEAQHQRIINILGKPTKCQNCGIDRKDINTLRNGKMWRKCNLWWINKAVKNHANEFGYSSVCAKCYFVLFTDRYGSKNSNWIDGRTFLPYPPSFNKRFKRFIHEKFNHTCQKCCSKKNLSVHHIDYNKNNTTEENCITLCMPCNASVNGNRNHWKKFFKNKLKILAHPVKSS